MNSGNFFAGLLIGAAAGMITGLLIAPSSGNQTRLNIVRRSKVYSQQAIDAVRQYLENVKNGRSRGVSSISAEELLNQYRSQGIV